MDSMDAALNPDRASLGLALSASATIHICIIGVLATFAGTAQRPPEVPPPPVPVLAATIVQALHPDSSASATPTPARTAAEPVPAQREGRARPARTASIVALPAPVDSTNARAGIGPDPPSADAARSSGEAAASGERAAMPADAKLTVPPSEPSPVAYLSNPAPAYPESARRDGRQGLTLLDVLVSKSGAPVEIAIAQSSGHAALDAAAVDSVRQWRFVPATRDSEAIDARIRIPIRFRLSE